MGTLLPTMGLTQTGLWPAMADRFAYVPLIGIFILIAWGVPDLIAGRRHRKTLLTGSATAVLLVLMVCTRVQISHWQNSFTLFKHAIKVTDNNSLAHRLVGHALDQQGKLDEAIMHYTVALRMNPEYSKAHNNLGTTFARKGNVEKAVYHYLEALRINPNYAGAYYNLGKIYANQGKTETAIQNYRKALDLNPEMTSALYQLGWLYATHENEVFRNGRAAMVLAEKLCRTTVYNQPLGLDVLAAAYAEIGDFSKAVTTAQKGIKLAGLYNLTEMSAALKKRLQTYQSGKPYRSMWRAPTDIK